MYSSAAKIERLEARIAPAFFNNFAQTSLSYVDLDDDQVTITVTKGNLIDTDFVFDTGFNFDGPQQLQMIDLQDDLINSGTNITVTVKPSLFGDGLAHIGYINATNIDLGTVTVKGDLGRIDAGDGNTFTPGVKALNVQSIGRFGLLTQGGGGSTDSNIYGALPSLTVKGGMNFATLNIFGGVNTQFNGKLGTAKFGGSLQDAAIFTDGNIGKITIGGSVRVSLIQAGATAAGGNLGSLTIQGSLTDSIVGAGYQMGAVTIRGSMLNSTIEGFGILGVTPAIDTAIKSVTIGGDMENSFILAGYDDYNVFYNADGSIGSVIIGGDFVKSNIVAGSAIGGDGSYGTFDDTLLAGNDTFRQATISKVIIKGQAVGTQGGSDAYGIVAETIVSAKVAGIGYPTFAFFSDFYDLTASTTTDVILNEI